MFSLPSVVRAIAILAGLAAYAHAQPVVDCHAPLPQGRVFQCEAQDDMVRIDQLVRQHILEQRITHEEFVTQFGTEVSGWPAALFEHSSFIEVPVDSGGGVYTIALTADDFPPVMSSVEDAQYPHDFPEFPGLPCNPTLEEKREYVWNLMSMIDGAVTQLLIEKGETWSDWVASVGSQQNDWAPLLREYLRYPVNCPDGGTFSLSPELNSFTPPIRTSLEGAPHFYVYPLYRNASYESARNAQWDCMNAQEWLESGVQQTLIEGRLTLEELIESYGMYPITWPFVAQSGRRQPPTCGLGGVFIVTEPDQNHPAYVRWIGGTRPYPEWTPLYPPEFPPTPPMIDLNGISYPGSDLCAEDDTNTQLIPIGDPQFSYIAGPRSHYFYVPSGATMLVVSLIGASLGDSLILEGETTLDVSGEGKTVLVLSGDAEGHVYTTALQNVRLRRGGGTGTRLVQIQAWNGPSASEPVYSRITLTKEIFAEGISIY